MAAAVAAALGGAWQSGHAEEEPAPQKVVVTAPRADKDLARQRASTSDSARLLEGQAGVSLYEAGGVSSLPVIHGLADERIRIQVDGMDLMAACPNHMNSALSYIDPSQVESVRVYAGITPVSVGGDSIAGSIQVVSATPRFAAEGEAVHATGKLAGFYRSNGQARGGSVHAELLGTAWRLSYSGASAQSDNYHAGADFKAAGPAALGRGWLAGDEVGSSAYKTENHELGLATRWQGHVLQLQASRQHIPYELYPNQRMDMTGNDSTQLNLRYSGNHAWGQLKARAFDQRTRHAMDMGPDRFNYGTGMPMDTRSRANGGAVQGDVVLSATDTLRLGAELHATTLYDWWSPVGTGMMAPNTYWNIDYGTRNRWGVFGEWERRWSAPWSSQVGLRHDTVRSDAGPVQGYNADPIWALDAAAFNARSRRRVDHNWDLTLLTRYEPTATWWLEGGMARKSRAPSLYERYPWSNQSMATLMNNFVGDGNGYIGNPDLHPEVAHTLSLSGDWHDASTEVWSVKLSGYVTQVDGYIDAQRCSTPMCGGAANASASTGFVNLRYLNQSARLHGLDLSVQADLGRHASLGQFSLNGAASTVHGSNTSTGQALYHQMPPNLRLGLSQNLAPWTQSLTWRGVAAKRRVSAVRNEVATPGYVLLDWHASFERPTLRVDAAIENLFNRAYAAPLGGAYAGQGASMATTSLPWGITVPGRGRSFNLALSLRY